VENLLEFLKAHAIVAMMNAETFPNTTTQQEIAKGQSTPEKKPVLYAELRERVHELKEALGEVAKEGYLFREKPVRNGGEKKLAELTLARDAYLGEAEKYAQQGNPEKEQGMRMLVQFKDAQMQMVSIYLDALRDSVEFADLIVEDNPWIVEMAGSYTEESLSEAEFEA